MAVTAAVVGIGQNYGYLMVNIHGYCSDNKVPQYILHFSVSFLTHCTNQKLICTLKLVLYSFHNKKLVLKLPKA